MDKNRQLHYLKLRNQQFLFVEDAGNDGGAIKQEEAFPGRGDGADLRRVGRRGRKKLGRGPGDAEQRLDARGPDEGCGGAALLLLDIVQERLDLAAQERLPGAGRAARGPAAGGGSGGGGGGVGGVEAARREADDGGVVTDVVQGGAGLGLGLHRGGLLGPGEEDGGVRPGRGALLCGEGESNMGVVRKHIQETRRD